jgi:four helix bundle protein
LSSASRCFHRGQHCRGFGKRSKAEKSRFLSIAEGSLEECRYYLILAQDLRYEETQALMKTLDEDA